MLFQVVFTSANNVTDRRGVNVSLSPDATDSDKRAEIQRLLEESFGTSLRIESIDPPLNPVAEEKPQEDQQQTDTTSTTEVESTPEPPVPAPDHVPTDPESVTPVDPPLSPVPQSVTPASNPAKPIAEMNRRELLAFAQQRGLTVDGTMRVDALRASILTKLGEVHRG